MKTLLRILVILIALPATALAQLPPPGVEQPWQVGQLINLSERLVEATQRSYNEAYRESPSSPITRQLYLLESQATTFRNDVRLYRSAPEDLVNPYEQLRETYNASLDSMQAATNFSLQDDFSWVKTLMNQISVRYQPNGYSPQPTPPPPAPPVPPPYPGRRYTIQELKASAESVASLSQSIFEQAREIRGSDGKLGQQILDDLVTALLNKALHQNVEPGHPRSFALLDWRRLSTAAGNFASGTDANLSLSQYAWRHQLLMERWNAAQPRFNALDPNGTMSEQYRELLNAFAEMEAAYSQIYGD